MRLVRVIGLDDDMTYEMKTYQMFLKNMKSLCQYISASVHLQMQTTVHVILSDDF